MDQRTNNQGHHVPVGQHNNSRGARAWRWLLDYSHVFAHTSTFLITIVGLYLSVPTESVASMGVISHLPPYVQAHSLTIVVWLSILWLMSALLDTAGRRKLSHLDTRKRELHRQLTELESRLYQASASYRDTLRKYLVHVSKEFGLGDTERVSLYKHEGAAFVRLARYSKGPTYDADNKSRHWYPDNEGCIGEAWNKGLSVVRNLPDYAEDPQTYIQEQAAWGLEPDVTENLTMKSRSYLATAIEDPSGENRIAVIVFESTRTTALPYDALIGAFKGQEGRYLTSLLWNYREWEPEPTIPFERGF